MDNSLNVLIRVCRNDDIVWPITVKNDGVVVDITGWTFFFTVKTSLDDEDSSALIKVDWSTHTDPTNGETQLTVPKASTNLTGEKYFDLQYKKTDGTIKTFLRGRIEFLKDATIRTVAE